MEGSLASAASRETEIRLTSVARASLEDSRDFLRTRDLPLWSKNSRETLFVRKLGRTPEESFASWRTPFSRRAACASG